MKRIDFSSMTKEELEIACNLLMKCIINQEKQMRFWLLSKDLENNKISEEDFNNEIDNNIEKYAFVNFHDTNATELRIASALSECLGENVEDNFYEFFEFTDKSVADIISNLTVEQNDTI